MFESFSRLAIEASSWDFPETLLFLLLPTVAIIVLTILFEQFEAAATQTNPSFVPLRGEGLVDVEKARERADAARKRDPHTPPGGGIRFGPVMLPFSALNTHFLFAGTTGSGKGVSLERMLSGILAAQSHAAKERMRFVVFDPKGELPAKLFARLPANSGLYLTHPFDARSWAWELAADFRTPAGFLQLASMLVPEDKSDQNRYFSDSARDLVYSVLLVLNHHAPGAWTLRDILLFCSPRRLKALLDLHAVTRDRIDQMLKSRSGKDVISTAISHLGKFGPVAACWHRASRSISLEQFMNETSALVLGHHASVSYALGHLNRLMVKRLCDLALDRQTPDDRTIFAFSEFRLFGKNEGLLEVAMRGRSSGACLLVDFQDINGLDTIHRDKSARELCALLQNRVFLKAGSTEHARFVSELLGKMEVKQYTTNTSATTNCGASKPASRSQTNSEQVVLRDAVLPAELAGLPLADPKLDRLAAYYQSPVTGSFFHEGPFLEDLGRLPVAQNFPNFIPRPGADQHLAPLNKADLVRLKLDKCTELVATL